MKKQTNLPKVTFGMIVLNGEPFIRYSLRALYPFAHQIIVVEGASPGAKNISTPNGHSTDSTLSTLQDFKAHEDPEQKLIIVTAEDEGYSNGFWPGEKHEQSQAYAVRATGDYLWQVDADEFYREEDMYTVLGVLREDESITALSFKQITFWGGVDYITDGWYLRRGWCAKGIHRVFRWGPGYRYVTHRPVTVHNAQGEDLRTLHWVDGNEWEQMGIYMYHYSLLFPKQVTEKSEYYKEADWAKHVDARRWADENYLSLGNPYRVHNIYEYPSWLERFLGNHPSQIEAMCADLQTGRIDTELRSTADIEKLLGSPVYRVGRAWLKFAEPFSRWWKPGVYWQERIERFTQDPRGGIKKVLNNILKPGTGN